jgi:hypothetical protein
MRYDILGAYKDMANQADLAEIIVETQTGAVCERAG